MFKVLSGSFMVVTGLMLSITGVGAIVGFPMFCMGIITAGYGLVSMGVFAAKTGVAAGKVVRQMNEGRAVAAGGPIIDAVARPVAAAPSVADEIAKLGALKDAGHLTEDEFAARKAHLLGT